MGLEHREKSGTQQESSSVDSAHNDHTKGFTEGETGRNEVGAVATNSLKQDLQGRHMQMIAM